MIDTCRCGHPKEHHDANECWTTPDGQETYGETSCSCSGYTLANCQHRSVMQTQPMLDGTIYNDCHDCGLRWAVGK